MASHPTSGPGLLALWRRLSAVPGGGWLFSRLLGFMVPYSGTIRARVRTLEPGRAVLTLDERRGVRNHLGSVHAVALANLGELTSGLATMTTLPPSVRGIVLGLEIEYHKKARGRLEARAEVALAPVTERREETVSAEITDADGAVVASLTARWLLAPREGSRR